MHSDRFAPMTSKCQLLADLGVTGRSSRPQVSDDNWPFSEAQFKTLKYHPGFPGRFEDITAAIAFCRSFFPWYNPSTAMPGRCSPPMVHPHRAPDVLAQRGRTLQPPGPFTPNASSTAPRNPPRFPKPSGSTHPPLWSSVNRNRRCLKVVATFRGPTVIHAGLYTSRQPRVRGSMPCFFAMGRLKHAIFHSLVDLQAAIIASSASPTHNHSSHMPMTSSPHERVPNAEINPLASPASPIRALLNTSCPCGRSAGTSGTHATNSG